MNVKKVKIFVFMTILAISVFPLNTNFSGMVKKVKAQSGPPYEIIKNPWINDTNYWEPQLANNPDPESWITLNASGFTVYNKKTTNLLLQPYGTAHAVQGYQWAKGLPPKFYGQGLNYYIYVPADIGEGKLILQVNTTRLMDPKVYNVAEWDSPFADRLNIWASLAAPCPATRLGVDLWFAVRVKYWDDSRVPEYLRGKEVYLGVFSQNVLGSPNNFILDVFTDVWYYSFEDDMWKPGSVEHGCTSLDYIGFLGSTEDWDWHSSRTLYTVENIGQWEYHEIDIGELIQDFMNWFNAKEYWNPLDSYGKLMLPWSRYKQLECVIKNAPVGHDGSPQCYDIVGFTLVAVGVTSEAVSSALMGRINYVQLLDYRDNGGEPPQDPLFFEFLDYWNYLYELGLPDAECEHVFRTIIPKEELQLYIGLDVPCYNFTVDEVFFEADTFEDGWVKYDYCYEKAYYKVGVKSPTIFDEAIAGIRWEWRWTPPYTSSQYNFHIKYTMNGTAYYEDNPVNPFAGNGISFHLRILNPVTKDILHHYEWKIVDNVGYGHAGVIRKYEELSTGFAWMENPIYAGQEYILELWLVVSAWRGAYIDLGYRNEGGTVRHNPLHGFRLLSFGFNLPIQYYDYTVQKIKDSPYGSVYVSKLKPQGGEVIYLKAVPNEGFVFDHWEIFEYIDKNPYNDDLSNDFSLLRHYNASCNPLYLFVDRHYKFIPHFKSGYCGLAFDIRCLKLDGSIVKVTSGVSLYARCLTKDYAVQTWLQYYEAYGVWMTGLQSGTWRLVFSYDGYNAEVLTIDVPDDGNSFTVLFDDWIIYYRISLLKEREALITGEYYIFSSIIEFANDAVYRPGYIDPKKLIYVVPNNDSYPIILSSVDVQLLFDDPVPAISISANEISELRFDPVEVYREYAGIDINSLITQNGLMGITVYTDVPLDLKIKTDKPPSIIFKEKEKFEDWEWMEGWLILHLEPGDPDFSINFKIAAPQKVRYVVYDFLPIILMIGFLIVIISFVRRYV